MADDEDDKIRRNLVAASFLTILSAWLDIPFIQLAVSALGIENKVIPEWRLWVVGLTVFLYLLVRYRFSREGFAYVQAIRDEMRKNLFFKAGAYVERRLKEFKERNFEHPMFGGGLSFAISKNRTKLSFLKTDEVGPPESSFSISIDERHEDPWDMLLRVESKFHLENGTTEEYVQRGVMIHRPSWATIQFIGFLARVHTFLYSEASVKNVFPIWMATASIFVFIWRIGQSYFVLWGGG